MFKIRSNIFLKLQIRKYAWVAKFRIWNSANVSNKSQIFIVTMVNYILKHIWYERWIIEIYSLQIKHLFNLNLYPKCYVQPEMDSSAMAKFRTRPLEIMSRCIFNGTCCMGKSVDIFKWLKSIDISAICHTPFFLYFQNQTRFKLMKITKKPYILLDILMMFCWMVNSKSTWLWTKAWKLFLP